MATAAQKLAKLDAQIEAIETNLAAARSGASSFSADGLSVTAWRLEDMTKELVRLNKSRQRLLRGGRGIIVDMSSGVPGGDAGDPYRSGSEVLL